MSHSSSDWNPAMNVKVLFSLFFRHNNICGLIESSCISKDVITNWLFLQTNNTLDKNFPAHFVLSIAMTVLMPLLHIITCFILIHYNVIVYLLPPNALYCKMALRVERFRPLWLILEDNRIPIIHESAVSIPLVFHARFVSLYNRI